MYFICDAQGASLRVSDIHISVLLLWIMTWGCMFSFDEVAKLFFVCVLLLRLFEFLYFLDRSYSVGGLSFGGEACQF